MNRFSKENVVSLKDSMMVMHQLGDHVLVNSVAAVLYERENNLVLKIPAICRSSVIALMRINAFLNHMDPCPDEQQMECLSTVWALLAMSKSDRFANLAFQQYDYGESEADVTESWVYDEEVN